ncbi:uncharacterized protein BP5553_06616 [Venustampulla echinocandica]|uniref:BHLH domain-containing protein n=1 Tax=Venustampulla echinocandica TaxID=2656787 RepID=A0A370TKF3_9HELO|nr:uncharacterized protein BP5553_06616 [Venustampulla echinocandica]RDL36004.1 hypothetical protein BP5553_06616 [Venustampulla echinocandica]
MSSVNKANTMVSPTGISDHSNTTAEGKRKAKKRVRAFTSEDRASHRAIEKQRREALNQSFLDLARLLPSLAHARRLSKSVIVNESISYLKTQREIRLAAASEVSKLLADYDLLRRALNNRVPDNSAADMLQIPPRPVSDALMNLLGVEQEEFGTFPGGFGDNGPGDEAEDQQAGESDHPAGQGNNEFTDLSNSPLNTSLPGTSSLITSAASAPDFLAIQPPLNMLAPNAAYETNPQGDLDPSNPLAIGSSSLFGNLAAANGNIPDQFLSANGWPPNIYSEPAFHSNCDPTQSFFSNDILSSQFREQPPMAENTSYGFAP